MFFILEGMISNLVASISYFSKSLKGKLVIFNVIFKCIQNILLMLKIIHRRYVWVDRWCMYDLNYACTYNSALGCMFINRHNFQRERLSFSLWLMMESPDYFLTLVTYILSFFCLFVYTQKVIHIYEVRSK